ncbi:uncharacterized protein ARMOST_16975 [Armillaria ostoyae]|uniref:Uncharacterized protein n=1 Tax=Armillaria ostoyae TaxID=47428 RepID=A0A284RXQ1_ARMOS|nr:uncharacterized protein ARMOST_16975 [Armillaria ostoyae]
MPQEQPFPIGRPRKGSERGTLLSPGAAGGVSQPCSLTSIQPVVASGNDALVKKDPHPQCIHLPLGRGNLRSQTPPGNADEEHLLKAAGDAKAMATKKIAAGQEAASAQAVNRGHSVTLIEVPDKDDNMVYQICSPKNESRQ